MPIISTRQHEKLIDFLRHETARGEVIDWMVLQEDVRLLQQLYNNYQSNLSTLRILASEYETLHKRIRMELRKQYTRTK